MYHIYIIFIYTVYMSYFYVSLMAFDALWFVALTFSSDSNNGCFPTQWQPCCQAGEAYLSACEGWRRWAMVLMGTDGGDWINSMVETKKLIPPPSYSRHTMYLQIDPNCYFDREHDKKLELGGIPNFGQTQVIQGVNVCIAKRHELCPWSFFPCRNRMVS